MRKRNLFVWIKQVRNLKLVSLICFSVWSFTRQTENLQKPQIVDKEVQSPRTRRSFAPAAAVGQTGSSLTVFRMNLNKPVCVISLNSSSDCWHFSERRNKHSEWIMKPTRLHDQNRRPSAEYCWLTEDRKNNKVYKEHIFVVMIYDKQMNKYVFGFLVGRQMLWYDWNTSLYSPE